jgi:hypothetical protein
MTSKVTCSGRKGLVIKITMWYNNNGEYKETKGGYYVR